ncbi:MAG TPA: hypothetical protein DIT34_08450 [Acinetobacter ursingii]|uniref:hypothetical protein n=1 Tax=Acinetobacter ursingii TaxID=108980 RepID=UPI0005C83FDA|nr:hypothetical protein [Acinetobacter ursingii]MCH2004669.1 hypothetical protein [Acinetobacter ursingii]MCU4482202.1 hypothetical protein [Acinetobacter ursingii]MCU4506489.1 hypothetical protein [Acinetobacter ursingii]MCU4570306.1 hypothetical protein [Acinetobacter ursingii]HCO08325.1 hypothetical protein [Acinetobacter ursingii]
MELEKKPAPHDISIAKTVTYLLLGIPASMCIGAIFAQVSTMYMDKLEGAAGQAAITIFIIISVVCYLISLILLPIFSKKKPEVLSATLNIFGLLTFIFLMIVLTI